MTSAEFQWTTPDGISIYAKNWPCPNPKAVIALVHGLGEHCNRYEHVAQYFNQRDFAVLAYDRRGHGRSGGKRGHSPSVSLLLDEIGALLIETQNRYPDVPVFLYGHSMGGNLALAYTLKRHPNVKGVIATAPWIQLAFQPPPILVALAKVMRNIYPSMIQRNNLKVEHISRDQAVVEAYTKDPFVHDFISAGLAAGMLETAAWLHAYTRPFPSPLLLMHGGSDQITSPIASSAFSERVPGGITWRLWADYYHEIHNDPGKEDVFDLMIEWMNARLRFTESATKSA